MIGWLIITASSAPDEVKRKYDVLLGAQHFEIAASDFGWVSQNRTFMGEFLVRLPRKRPKPFGQNMACVFSHCPRLWLTTQVSEFALQARSQFQRQVHIENGFLLDMDPRAVMEARAPALHPFTEEFCIQWTVRTPH